MKNFNGDRFDGRLKAASEAKKKQLSQFKVAEVDPEKVAKRAAKQALAATREAERKAKAEKLMQEKDALAQQQAEVAEREKALEVEDTSRDFLQKAASAADKKAERDRRYAARQNRKR